MENRGFVCFFAVSLFGAIFSARLQSVAICDEWTSKMLKQVNEWEKENNYLSQKFVQNLKNKIVETQEKLDKLVSAANDLKDFGQTEKNWPILESVDFRYEKSQKFGFF